MPEELLSAYYNLFLEPELRPNERQLLQQFKQSIEGVKESQLEAIFLNLIEEIRLLSLRKIGEESLSLPLAAFYKRFAYIGEKKKQEARGAASLGLFFR